ncbi:ParB/RepB/Spo0J family partition protein [Timonella senegalensis]|uniref:ParB/RepB/Spo0J family partition protein n=1 Tax=Timonella senegalensis TaxID=1465825 RepID=UPI002FDD07DC
MTRTAVPAPETAPATTSAIDALADQPHQKYALLDLGSLEVAPNVRVTVDLKGLVDSIKQNGVLIPILVRLTVLDRYEVIEGQRRTLAAREAGLTVIPAVILDSVTDESDRIVTQIVANDEREAVSTWETAQALKQMHLMGTSISAIAKRTGKNKDTVKAALAVAGDADNAAIFDQDAQMDLVKAAQIAEFAGHEDLTEQLKASATDHDAFEHMLARAARVRADREELAAETDKWSKLGYEVLGTMPYSNPEYKELYELSKDAEAGSGLSEADHSECPGRAVYLWQVYEQIMTRQFCGSWKTAGHYVRAATNSSGSTSGEQSEEKKAERRRTIEMNKNADAAIEVQEKWLHEFFERPLTALPKDLHVTATQLIIVLLKTHHPLLEVEAKRFAGDMEPTTTGATGKYLFALACGTVWKNRTRDYWRSTYEQNYMVPFLRAISAMGYPLADFEQDLLDAEDTE